MDLLFRRSQTHKPLFSIIPLILGGSVVFHLHAELELTDEELALARRYYFHDVELTSSSRRVDLLNASQPAWFLGFASMVVATYGVFQFLPQLGSALRGFDYYAIAALMFLMIPVIGIAVAMVMTVVYYFAMRERITVGQLLDGGRTFRCHSVVELDEKEAQLLSLCRRLDTTLKKAENWGGRQAFPIPEGASAYRSSVSESEADERPGLFEELGRAAGETVADASTEAKDFVKWIKNKLPERFRSGEDGRNEANTKTDGSPGAQKRSAQQPDYEVSAPSPAQPPPPSPRQDVGPQSSETYRPMPQSSSHPRNPNDGISDIPAEHDPLADLLPPKRPPE